jgi:hypothetical protein
MGGPSVWDGGREGLWNGLQFHIGAASRPRRFYPILWLIIINVRIIIIIIIII